MPKPWRETIYENVSSVFLWIGKLSILFLLVPVLLNFLDLL